MQHNDPTVAWKALTKGIGINYSNEMVRQLRNATQTILHSHEIRILGRIQGNRAFHLNQEFLFRPIPTCLCALTGGNSFRNGVRYAPEWLLS